MTIALCPSGSQAGRPGIFHLFDPFISDRCRAADRKWASAPAGQLRELHPRAGVKLSKTRRTLMSYDGVQC